MKAAPSRYYFSGMRVGNIARLWSAALVVGSLVAIAVLRNPVAWAIFGVSALAGAYGTIRAREPQFYVELAEDHLVLKALVTRRLRYDDIATVEFYRYPGGLAAAVEHFGVFMGRLFGSQIGERVGKPGEVDESKVEVKFDGTKWQFFPLPPFVLPRRSWLLAVEDAPSLRAEIDQRLPRPLRSA